jgi:hypothetical protein
MDVELYRRDGASYRRITMTRSDGQVIVATIEMGATTKMIIGHDQYEFRIAVDQDNWGDLCEALITEYLGGDRDATDKLSDLCARHGVPHDWTSKP